MKMFIEGLFGLYKITARQYFTSYYSDVEKVGKLTGVYYHLDNGKWVEGVHPKFK